VILRESQHCTGSPGGDLKNKDLTSVEEQLLKWFEKRPMQKVSAEELRDEAKAIWGRSLLDGPRVARLLWEKGLLERNNGTRAPYWFVSMSNRENTVVDRERALFAQAIKATRSRIKALAVYADRPNVVSTNKAVALREFCALAIEQLDAAELD